MYLMVVAGVLGCLVMVVVIGWLVWNYWYVILWIIGILGVMVWGFVASDHVNSHGWQYKPNELAKLDDKNLDDRESGN